MKIRYGIRLLDLPTNLWHLVSILKKSDSLEYFQINWRIMRSFADTKSEDACVYAGFRRNGDKIVNDFAD